MLLRLPYLDCHFKHYIDWTCIYLSFAFASMYNICKIKSTRGFQLCIMQSQKGCTFQIRHCKVCLACLIELSSWCSFVLSDKDLYHFTINFLLCYWGQSRSRWLREGMNREPPLQGAAVSHLNICRENTEYLKKK